MATLAEQRKDEELKSKDSTHTLNASKADGHISTQESLNELNRQPQIIPPNVLKKSSTTNLTLPIGRSDTTEELPEEHTTPASTSTKRAKPFILSSRAAFDEENIFAASRVRIPSKENLISPHDQNLLCEETNQRNDASELPDNTPRKSHGLRIQTPPNKKAKHVFKRTVDATFNPSGVQGRDIILASDSDEECS